MKHFSTALCICTFATLSCFAPKDIDQVTMGVGFFVFIFVFMSIKDEE